MSTLTELGLYLEGLGLATQGTDLFLGVMPDAPDKVLCLYEYPGGSPDYIQNQDMPAAERPQIQVTARAVDYETASLLIAAAWQSLVVVRNATLSGVYYRSIRPNSSPAIMKRDSNERTIMFFNASIEKEVSIVSIS